MIAGNQFTEVLLERKSKANPSVDMRSLNVGKFGNLPDGLADAHDDFRGHPGRRHDAKPVRGLKSRHCTFSYGWHLWQKRKPLLRGDPQRLHLALLDERHDSNWRSPDQRNLPAEQVIERRCGPAIWHMVDFNLRGRVQPRSCQVMWGA